MLPALPTPYETLAEVERLLRDTSVNRAIRTGEAICLCRSALAIREKFQPHVPETYFLLVDYGRQGRAFVETEPGTSFTDMVQILRRGDIRGRIVGVYRAAETFDDVSKIIAGAVAAGYGDDLPEVTRDFCADMGVQLREVA